MSRGWSRGATKKSTMNSIFTMKSEKFFFIVAMLKHTFLAKANKFLDVLRDD
jgi:hypothetical protein